MHRATRSMPEIPVGVFDDATHIPLSQNIMRHSSHFSTMMDQEYIEHAPLRRSPTNANQSVYARENLRRISSSQADHSHQRAYPLRLGEESGLMRQSTRRPSIEYAEPAVSLHRFPTQVGNLVIPAAPAPVPKNADDQALEHGLLLSTQESQYGMNMYDAMTAADEPEIQHLVAQGYSVDDAILIIFERRCPPMPVDETPGVSYYNSRGVQERRTSADSRDSHYSRQTSPYETTTRSQNSMNSSFHKKSSFSRPSSFFSSRSSSAGNMERQEDRRIKRELKYKQSHVDRLMEMGFSKEQSIQALVQSNHNVEAAASMLIGSY